LERGAGGWSGGLPALGRSPAGTLSYAALAKDLATTEGALRVAVHRLREQYRDRLRAEVAHTVSNPSEVDAELRYLISVISGGT